MPSPAFLHVGGALVVRHQVALALAVGCRRIVCMAAGFSAHFAEVQRDAEQAGATFHLASSAAALSGVITAADEVLVLAEGLLPTPGDALPLIDGPSAIIVQPADEGIAAGYERVDLNYAWGGVMLIPGRLVDRLMNLAADIDPASALLRIALQAGLPLRPVPDAVRAGGRWLLIHSEADAQLAEERWMVRHTAGGPRTAGAWLARLVVRRFGAAMLHEGGSILVGIGLALVLVVLALAAAWFGKVTLAFTLAAVARLFQAISGHLIRLRGDVLGQSRRAGWWEPLIDGGFDLIVVALLTTAMRLLPGETLVERAFAPVVLLGLLRLLPRVLAGIWLEWLEDRVTLLAVLAVLAAGNLLAIAVPALSAGLLVAGLVLAAKQGERTSAPITRA